MSAHVALPLGAGVRYVGMVKRGTAKRPVLVLGGPGRVIVAVARSLHSHEIPVDAARFRSMAAPGLHSRAVRQRFTLADYTGNREQFLGEMTALIERHGYDMVIPASDAALEAVSACYEPLSRLVHLGCPAPAIVRSILDKSVTLGIAAGCGIPIPQSPELTASGDAGPVEGIRFPLVCKPKIKSAQSRFRIQHLNSCEELNALRKSLPNLEQDYLLQEYCDGVGIGVEVLLWNGEPVAVFQHRRVRENPASGGVSIVAESEAVDPVLADAAVRLLRRIGWSGPAMVEFRRNETTGRSILMEINGRPWGSLALPCLAGVEFPYLHWQLLHGERPRPISSYPEGLRVRWSTGEFLRLKRLTGDCLHRKITIAELAREAIGACKSLTDRSYDAMAVPGDRLPGFAELWFIATRRLKPLFEMCLHGPRAVAAFRRSSHVAK